MEEKTISDRQIFSGKILKLHVQEVELPNGDATTREIVRHPGAAAVVAVAAAGRIVMVRQFRKPVERVLLEIPAGKLDPGEPPEQCMRRELAEETGYVAGRLEPLVSYTPSPGFCDEVLHVFLATDLRPGRANPDKDEFIEVQLMPLDELMHMVDTGGITDGKTVTALLAYDRLTRRG